MQRRIDDATRMLETAWRSNSQNARGDLALAYALAGRREDAEKLVSDAGDLFVRARIFAALQDRERTLEILDRARSSALSEWGGRWRFRSTHSCLATPRLKGIRKKVGLPE